MSTKKILSNSLFYTLIAFLQPSISFLLLPLYLKYLTPADYAVYNLMNYLSFFIGIIAAGRIYSSIYPFYYDQDKTNLNIKEFMGSIMVFTLISAILLLSITILVGPFIFSLLFSNDIDFFPLGIYAIGAGILLSISLPFQVLFRNQKKFLTVGIIQLSLIFGSVSLQILFIVVLKEGVNGALFAKLLASTIPVLLAVIFGLKEIKVSFKKSYLKRALSFTLPLIPFSIITWFERFGDKFFLEHYVSLETLAAYSFLITICLMIVMVSDAILSVLQPFLYELYSSSESGISTVRINRYYTFYIFIPLVFSSFLILVGGQLPVFIDKSKYIEAIQYLPFAVLIYFLYSYIILFRYNLMFYKKSIILTSTSFWSLIVLIISYIVLMPRFGIWGALISNLMGFALLFLLLLLQNRKALKLEINNYQFYFLPIGLAILTFLLHLLCTALKIPMSYYSFLQFIIVISISYLTNKQKIFEIGAMVLSRKSGTM